jgi:three-Cys-motif partner protein
VATPKSVIWDCDAHTQAKHAILRGYLEAWLPILLQGHFRGVTYAEGFAGSGIYTGGEPGSPIVALEAFFGHRGLFSRHAPINVICVEEDERRADELRRQIDAALSNRLAPRPAGLRVEVHRGDCADRLVPLLNAVDAFGKPILAFLDSFGGPDVPFPLLERIARNPSSEVIVTFGTNFLTRFGGLEQHARTGDAAFGDDDWRAVTEQLPQEKKTFLVTSYRQALVRAGFEYTLVFELVDESGHPLFLVFGTCSPKGLKVMKDAMWKVDPIEGVRYRDPRDPSQELLEFDFEPTIGGLRRMIEEKLRTDGPASVEQLRHFALVETVHRPEHVPPVLKQMLEQGRLERTPAAGQLSKEVVVRLLDGPAVAQDVLF